MYAAWGYGQEEALFLLIFGRRSYLLHVTAGWGWGCWSWAASSGGSKRGRGHVVSKGMVELLDLKWRSDASGVIVLDRHDGGSVCTRPHERITDGTLLGEANGYGNQGRMKRRLVDDAERECGNQRIAEGGGRHRKGALHGSWMRVCQEWGRERSQESGRG